MEARKVVLDLAVSLDGFIEDANGETDWCIMDDDMEFDAFLASVDTIFYGRISYEAWGRHQPSEDATEADKALWEAVHSKKKYVFSRQQHDDEEIDFVSADIPKKVALLKQQPGKDIWLYGGASLIKTFIRYDLIDVYRLSIHPIVLGDGKPLFEDLQRRTMLRLKDTRVFRSGVVQLIYEPEREA